MKRKIYDKLLEWKQTRAGSTALMIDGARRVGKSWIAEEFAKNEYPAYLLIDFATVSAKVKRYFNEYLENLDSFFLYLLSAYDVELPRGSLIIFDEVQRFPRAREAIKYLVADGRYHYIETGSLISIRKNVKDIVIPSEEHHIEMFPLDFDEFLMATGHAGVLPVMEKHFRERIPLGRDTHESVMDLLRQYMVVGGMPQAVAKFVETHSLREVEAVKRDILALYRADISKFAGALRHKVAAVFGSIPSQLSRHETRFVLADLKKGAKMRDYDSAFEWLRSAMTVNICSAVTEPTVGLEMRTDVLSLRCYLGDTGLLVSMAFAAFGDRSVEIQGRLLGEALSVDKGMLMENLVAQMIRASGHDLHFYANSDREEKENRMEIDFLLLKPTLTRRHNIVPVEVKSIKDYTTTSLDKFREKFAEQLHEPVVLHPKDVKTDKGVLYLPLYMAQLLVVSCYDSP